MTQTVRRCQMCGAIFPPGTVAVRKYCYACMDIRHKEQRERAKAKRRAERAAAPPPEPTEPEDQVLTEENKAYCGVCEYHGSFNEGYLCNYIMMTGNVRGCKAGDGCTQRKIHDGKAIYERRICERCGAEYIGTKTSHICIACRREVLRENCTKR